MTSPQPYASPNSANDLLQSPAGKQWKSYGVDKHHGINTPLFALHTSQSSGIGEFPDLLPLIPWMKSVGFGILQLLPLNDTGLDTSPYNALSSCALNPIHLGLVSLPGKEDLPALFEELKGLKSLNATPFVDYKRVRIAKNEWLAKYFKAMKSIIDLEDFIRSNPWIKSYALFKSLKEINDWKNWIDWPESHRPKNQDEFERLYQDNEEAARFHIFIQKLCMDQMEAVKKEANKHKVLIKGDIPILISPDSADVWREPHLFKMDYSAGAPPDMYSKEGQYWGFPLFDWKKMEEDNYRWWIQRLKTAERFYHLYRIDHIVGFYRIWAVPRGKKALEGQFEPLDQSLWISHGEKILTMMLENCDMLPIGEDLGTIPPEVRISMRKLGICGTKVMRWEREWNTPGAPFIPINDYIKASMTTVSVHDSDPVNLWWEHEPEEAKVFARSHSWEYTTPIPLEYYQRILWESHHTTSLLHINLLQEYLGQFPDLHQVNRELERINVPGIISDRNWSCRNKPSVEQIVKHEGLKDLLVTLSH